MESKHKVELRLCHPVEVGEAAAYLLRELECDNWWVACQREHLLVVDFSKSCRNKYAVCFECTSPVEKAIYHGSKTWSLSIRPFGSEPDLPQERIAEIKAGLAQLEQGAGTAVSLPVTGVGPSQNKNSMHRVMKVNIFKNLFSRHQHTQTATSSSVSWPGQSGKQYQYDVYPIEVSFQALPGNYIYAKQAEDGTWSPVYIAQTRDLHQRLEGHVKVDDAVAQGATHIHAHYDSSGQAARCSEERDLILQWQPVCNDPLEKYE